MAVRTTRWTLAWRLLRDRRRAARAALGRVHGRGLGRQRASRRSSARLRAPTRDRRPMAPGRGDDPHGSPPRSRRAPRLPASRPCSAAVCSSSASARSSRRDPSCARFATSRASLGALGAGDLRARSGSTRSDELGDVARAFDEMAAQIERLLRAEKELLANVSHELRTPLARIRVALDIAPERPDPRAIVCRWPRSGSISPSFETLIDDILTTARLEVARGPSAASGFALHPEEIGADVLCDALGRALPVEAHPPAPSRST